ncbi:MAG: DUF308 domain-containing protein [Eubacteriales bacterium]|nr:DUF308 domain-containing protein [Eubacteriales bacterium]
MKDKSILKTVKTVYSAVAVLECILGLVMLCYPGFSLSALGVILGIGLVLFGVVELIAYFSGSAPLILSRNVLAGGIFFIILGVLVLTNPLGLMNFICIVIGVGILADSLFKLQSVLDVRQFMSRGSWWLVFAALLLSVLAGILLVFWPGESGRALIVLLGIGLLLNGAFNIFDVVYVTRYVKEFKDYYHTNFDYSDVVDYQDDDRNN